MCDSLHVCVCVCVCVCILCMCMCMTTGRRPYTHTFVYFHIEEQKRPCTLAHWYTTLAGLMCVLLFRAFLSRLLPRLPLIGPKRRPGGADVCATLLPSRAIAVAGLASGLSFCCFFLLVPCSLATCSLSTPHNLPTSSVLSHSLCSLSTPLPPLSLPSCPLIVCVRVYVRIV